MITGFVNLSMGRLCRSPWANNGVMFGKQLQGSGRRQHSLPAWPASGWLCTLDIAGETEKGTQRDRIMDRTETAFRAQNTVGFPTGGHVNILSDYKKKCPCSTHS